MKYFLGFFIFFSFFCNTFGNDNSIYYQYYDKIKLFLQEKSDNDIYKQKVILDEFLDNFELKNKDYIIFKEILLFIQRKILKEINNFENTTQKVFLGYSEGQKEIYGYFRGNPKGYFTGIFANIHGGYEYGAYDTAMYLIKELEKQNKKNWFIIPTLNPDGLEVAKKDNFLNINYISGRGNKNGIDLNRNFCTLDFVGGDYIKEETILSKGFFCNSESEVKLVLDVLDKYKFKNIIDLHSAGGIFFIPDYSIDDYRIINLGNNLKKALGSQYNFNLNYKDEDEKLRKIKLYEINERGKNFNTGVMVNYIYEKYNIPVIIVELKEHGKIEKNLIKFFE